MLEWKERQREADSIRLLLFVVLVLLSRAVLTRDVLELEGLGS
jgi:hypothetical protein